MPNGGVDAAARYFHPSAFIRHPWICAPAARVQRFVGRRAGKHISLLEKGYQPTARDYG
jgi:hypothetical protein